MHHLCGNPPQAKILGGKARSQSSLKSCSTVRGNQVIYHTRVMKPGNRGRPASMLTLLLVCFGPHAPHVVG
jgi:hypothetical protein